MHIFFCIREGEPFREGDGKHFQRRVAFSLFSEPKALCCLNSAGCKKNMDLGALCALTLVNCLRLEKLLIHAEHPFSHREMKMLTPTYFTGLLGGLEVM